MRQGNSRKEISLSCRSAERTGAFKTISTPDTTGYITTQIPTSYKPGEYKLRVVSSAPYLVSQTTNVSIVSPTTTILAKGLDSAGRK